MSDVVNPSVTTIEDVNVELPKPNIIDELSKECTGNCFYDNADKESIEKVLVGGDSVELWYNENENDLNEQIHYSGKFEKFGYMLNIIGPIGFELSGCSAYKSDSSKVEVTDKCKVGSEDPHWLYLNRVVRTSLIVRDASGKRKFVKGNFVAFKTITGNNYLQGIITDSSKDEFTLMPITALKEEDGTYKRLTTYLNTDKTGLLLSFKTIDIEETDVTNLSLFASEKLMECNAKLSVYYNYINNYKKTNDDENNAKVIKQIQSHMSSVAVVAPEVEVVEPEVAVVSPENTISTPPTNYGVSPETMTKIREKAANIQEGAKEFGNKMVEVGSRGLSAVGSAGYQAVGSVSSLVQNQVLSARTPTWAPTVEGQKPVELVNNLGLNALIDDNLKTEVEDQIKVLTTSVFGGIKTDTSNIDATLATVFGDKLQFIDNSVLQQLWPKLKEYYTTQLNTLTDSLVDTQLSVLQWTDDVNKNPDNKILSQLYYVNRVDKLHRKLFDSRTDNKLSPAQIAFFLKRTPLQLETLLNMIKKDWSSIISINTINIPQAQLSLFDQTQGDILQIVKSVSTTQPDLQGALFVTYDWNKKDKSSSLAGDEISLPPIDAAGTDVTVSTPPTDIVLLTTRGELISCKPEYKDILYKIIYFEEDTKSTVDWRPKRLGLSGLNPLGKKLGKRAVSLKKGIVSGLQSGYEYGTSALKSATEMGQRVGRRVTGQRRRQGGVNTTLKKRTKRHTKKRYQ